MRPSSAGEVTQLLLSNLSLSSDQPHQKWEKLVLSNLSLSSDQPHQKWEKLVPTKRHRATNKGPYIKTQGYDSARTELSPSLAQN